MSIKIRNALPWIIVFQLVAYAISCLQSSSIDTWYVSLQKSSLTPPNIVFPLVWFVLYCMLAIAGSILWQYREQTKAKSAFFFFAVQILLNWIWTPLFFYFHHIGLALLCILGMIVLTTVTIILSYRAYKITAFLLIPYLIWLLFAAYLNAVIWQLNAALL